MTQCQRDSSAIQLQIPSLGDKPVVVEFSAGQQSSDTGLLVMAALERKYKLIDRLARHIPDARQQGKVRHSLWELLVQRVLQVAAGYEDCNDADSLRRDPAMKLSCGRLPSDDDLASQPTLSRLENSVSLRVCQKLCRELIKFFISQHKRPPRRVVIDLDTTDDALHGNQQLRFFHGYYAHYCYLPLIAVAQADRGPSWPLFSWLRPAMHAERFGAATWLLVILKAMTRAWHSTQLIVRADSGFASPDIYRLCEHEGVSYVIGLARNGRLEKLSEQYMQRARVAYQHTGQPVRVFGEFFYQAASWRRQRTVVVKAQITATGGENLRFVVHNSCGMKPEQVWEFYCGRGDMENRIKELKLALRVDKTSCHSFAANAFRVVLTTVAYLMYVLLRTQLAGSELARAQVWRLRERIVKVAGWFTESVRRVLVRCPGGYPWPGLWVQLCGAFS